MAVIRKFGQYVLLQVHDANDTLVFETDSLKVDFDIRHIKGWSRAKFTLTNLNPKTIRRLSGVDNDLFVTVKVALHDAELSTIADRLFVSNAMEEVKLPQSLFNMYCYSRLRRYLLEKQVDIMVFDPTLEKLIKKSAESTGFTGEVEFKHFPPELLAYKAPQKHTRQQGSMLSILETNGGMYGFNTYTEDNKLVLMYKPDVKNVVTTSFYSGVGDIVLATSNMRSNPKIGPATLSVVSNLDPRIKPTSILDISKLLTLGTTATEETLQVAEDYLRDKVSGFSKYQALAVQHKGSNWSSQWQTQVAATSPTPGTTMPTTNWWA